MSTQIDARGLSCPQPALLTRQAVQNAGAADVTVLLDSMAQVQNCTRAAELLGWEATCEERAGEFVLSLRQRSPGQGET